MDNSYFYDSFFERTRNKITFTHRILVRSILNTLKDLGFCNGQNARLLELGCGRGWLASHLTKFGSVVAIDMALETVKANKQIYPHIDFRVGDVTSNLEFHSEFDVVISMEVVEHLPYAKQPDLIESAYTALKTGGFFILTTPNKTVNEKLGVKGFQPIEDWLTAEEARELVSRRFRVLDQYTVVFRFRAAIVDALWKRLFYPINMFMVQKWIRNTNLGKHIIVVVKKD